MIVIVALGSIMWSVTASAKEQCRFISPKLEREACYKRQDEARSQKQKPVATTRPDPIEQMRREDDNLSRKLRGICTGC